MFNSHHLCQVHDIAADGALIAQSRLFLLDLIDLFSAEEAQR